MAYFQGCTAAHVVGQTQTRSLTSAPAALARRRIASCADVCLISNVDLAARTRLEARLGGRKHLLPLRQGELTGAEPAEKRRPDGLDDSSEVAGGQVVLQRKAVLLIEVVRIGRLAARDYVDG